MSSHPDPGLADQLRDHTHGWHRSAERSGIVRMLLRGLVSRHGYALYLRSLLPAYQQMEAALQRHRQAPGIRWIARSETYRAAAIESSLEALCGPQWSDALPLLSAATDYAERIADAAHGDGLRLIGHAYVRYLGDLNGGQILRGCLIRSPGLEPEALTFYDFPDIHDLQRFKDEYRAGFDKAAAELVDADEVIAEAIIAFQLNIAVSESVAAQIA